MDINVLFENRKTAGWQLKHMLVQQGYTKASLACKAVLPLETVAQLLEGRMENRKEFEVCFHKILSALGFDEQIFVLAPASLNSALPEKVDAPAAFHMDDKARSQYDLLLDLLDLCAIYY